MDTVFILFNRFNTAAFITGIFADSGAAFIRGRSLFLNSKNPFYSLQTIWTERYKFLEF